MSSETASKVAVTEMPLEGIAAYWLSLRKVMGNKVSAKVAREEAERTDETYIKYVLTSAFNGLNDEQFLRLARSKAETVLRSLRHRYGMISEALLSMSAGENPRKSLMRMSAYFPSTRIPEDRISKMALEMVRKARDGGVQGFTVTIDDSTPADQLLVKLMFYVFWLRHEGGHDFASLSESSRSIFFREGISMLGDGFDRSFIKTCLDLRRNGLVEDAALKLKMTAELARGLREGMSYDELFALGQAFMP